MYKYTLLFVFASIVLFKRRRVLEFIFINSSKPLFKNEVNPVHMHNHQKAQEKKQESSHTLPRPVIAVVNRHKHFSQDKNSRVKEY